MHTACGLGRGVQAGGGDVGAATRALAVGAGFDAGQGGLDRRQVCGLAFVQGKFQLAFGGNLGTRVFRLSEVVGAASARPMTPPRCAASWASNSDCWANNCWRKGAAWVLSMRGLLGVIGYLHGAPVRGALG